MWKSHPEILENPETQAIPPEIQTPVVGVGHKFFYFLKPPQVQPKLRVYRTTEQWLRWEYNAPIWTFLDEINAETELCKGLNINWVSDPWSQVTVLNPATSEISELYFHTYMKKIPGLIAKTMKQIATPRASPARPLTPSPHCKKSLRILTGLGKQHTFSWKFLVECFTHLYSGDDNNNANLQVMLQGLKDVRGQKALLSSQTCYQDSLLLYSTSWARRGRKT